MNQEIEKYKKLCETLKIELKEKEEQLQLFKAGSNKGTTGTESTGTVISNN